MSESTIVRSIMNWLNSQPDCMAMKVHGSVFSINEPDIVGTCRGQTFALEVKVPGKKPREAQVARMRQWRTAGAIVEVPTSLFDAKAVIVYIRERVPDWPS